MEHRIINQKAEPDTLLLLLYAKREAFLLSLVPASLARVQAVGATTAANLHHIFFNKIKSSPRGVLHVHEK
jgi:hypothetical protein